MRLPLNWRITKSPTLLLFLCCAVAWSAAIAAVPTVKWQKVVTPQFTLYSPAKGKEVLGVAQEFQQFVEALNEIIRIDRRALPPLTIVMFDRQKEFRPYRPSRPDGKPWDVAGFFSRQEGWAVFGLAGPAMDEEVRRTVFHEGVHWFLSGFDLPNPPWLEEGLAEVFSTFAVEKDQRKWGQPIVSHVEDLRSLRPLPLERLLAVSRDDPLFNETRRTGLFYAESWAFVHYLLFSAHHQDRSLFAEYLKAFRSEVHPDDAFKAVFKKDYTGMDRELADYLRNGKYFVSSKPLSASTGTLKVEPATELELEVALARLALASGRQQLAEEHVLAAERAGPGLAVTSEVAGYAAAARKDTAAMLDYFSAAAERGSKDYRVYYDLAQHAHQAVTGFAGMAEIPEKEARQIASNYAMTLELRPWYLPAYQGLGGIAGLLKTDNQAYRAKLESGHERYPQDGMILLGLASTSYRAGAEEEARQRLSEVLAGKVSHPDRVVAYARRLEKAWAQAADNATIRSLVEAKRYEEALVAIDELLARGVSQSSRGLIMANRANVAARAMLQQAQVAWNDQRWEEARGFLEAVLASPIQTAAKHEARRRLSELDRRQLGRK